MYFLPRRVGLQKAKDLIFSGRSVEAAEAIEIGLVDILAHEGTLLENAQDYGERFTGSAPGAIMLMKSIVNRSLELPLESIAALSAEAQAICYTSSEHRAAIEQFLSRDPK